MDTINGLSLEVDDEGALTNQSDLLRIKPKEGDYVRLSADELDDS